MSLATGILGVLILSSALCVVFMPNPIHGALSLIFNLICVAVLFALMDAHFLAVAQIIVYAGAIMVLVMFVLMLLNLKQEAKSPRTLLYLFPGVFFAALLLTLLLGQLSVGFPGGQQIKPMDAGAAAVGKLLYSEYIFPFEIASVLIMVAIVGAVILAKRSYKEAEKALKPR